MCVWGSSYHVPGLHAQTGSTWHGTGESRLHLYNTVHQGMGVSGRTRGRTYLDLFETVMNALG